MIRTMLLSLVGFLPYGLAMADASLTACRHIQNDMDRLICYDRLVDREYGNRKSVADPVLHSTPSVGSIRAHPTDTTSDPASAIVPPEQTAFTQEIEVERPADVRPASQPHDQFGRPRQPGTDLDEMAAIVSSITTDPFDRLVVTLDNHQVWQQINSRRLRLEAGDQVIIKAGRFDSYQLQKLGASLTIRVKRIDP
ncbi:MAG: hypothetical protein O2780_01260 [Proteobacteria bacterium]|nr:hypothetical protein [Pseudomonadota bacterium]